MPSWQSVSRDGTRQPSGTDSSMSGLSSHTLGVVVVKTATIVVLIASLVTSVSPVTVSVAAAHVPHDEKTVVREWGKPEISSLSDGEGLQGAMKTLEKTTASRVMEHCRRLGMRGLLDETFRLAEPGRLESTGYVVVPLINPRGDRFATALLYREKDAAAVAFTVDTVTGELLQTVSPGGEQELTSFDKKKWSDCFAVSCSVCIAGCAFTGPLWLKCMAACCGVSAATCAAIALQE